jgi:hypothetical protein
LNREREEEHQEDQGSKTDEKHRERERQQRKVENSPKFHSWLLRDRGGARYNHKVNQTALVTDWQF